MTHTSALKFLRIRKRVMLPALIVFAIMMLLAITPVAASSPDVDFAFGGNPGGNQECPFGTTQVAKFNTTEAGAYDLEGINSGNVVISNADLDGGDWSASVLISHIVIKGGPNATIDAVNPPAMSGTFTNVNIPVNGGGNTPDISNIKFCSPDAEPETGSITIFKQINDEQYDRGFDFNFAEGDTVTPFIISDEGADNTDSERTFSGLPAGEYTISEVLGNLPEGWNYNGATCATTEAFPPARQDVVALDLPIGNGSITLALEAGQDIYCHFGNTYTPPPPAPTCEDHVDNLVVNGCFEEPVVSGGSWNIYDDVPGWDIAWLNDEPCRTEINPSLELQTEATLGNVDVIQGDQYAELDTDCDGPSLDTSPERTTVEISQTLTTIPGHTYEVSFNFTARPGHGGQNLSASVNGVEAFSEAPPAGWEERTFEFVANSYETVIAFSDTGVADTFGVLLDCVNVLDQGSETGRLRVIKTLDRGVFNPDTSQIEFEVCVFYGQDVLIDCHDLSEANNWRYTWTLPIGNYTVRETIDNLAEGWSAVVSEVETQVASETLTTVRVRNVYVAPERPEAETCIVLNEFVAGTNIDGVFLDDLVAVSTSNGETLITQQGNLTVDGWWGGNSSVATRNYTNNGFGLMDVTRVHDYEFTFAPNIRVTDFSVRVFDWGDYNPARASRWGVQLVSPQSGNPDGLSFNTSVGGIIGDAGDAMDALIGQPGNRRYAIDGASLQIVNLNFLQNGNANYSASLIQGGQVVGGTSADPHIGLDELCITYEEIEDGSIRVTKWNDVNGNGTRQNATEPRMNGWEMVVYDGNTEIARRTTRNNGRTTFNNIAPGTYTVCEVQQDGWVNTTGGECQQVEVTEGARTSINFGNHELPRTADVTLIKLIEWNGNLENDAVTFELCLGQLCGEANVGNGYTVVFQDVELGIYALSEALAGGWTVSYPSGEEVTVTADGDNTFYITNTADAPPELGSITIYKNVNWNGVTEDINQGFTLCLEGELLNAPLCGSVGYNGGSVTFTDLPAGTYNAYEWAPGEGWQTPTGGGQVVVAAGGQASTTIYNVHNEPPPPPCEALREHLTGSIAIDGLTAYGTVYNNSDRDCRYQVGMASYYKYDEVIDNQIIFAGFDTVVTIPAGGSIQLSISLPECATQVDLFYGPYLQSLNGQRYGDRLLDAVHLSGTGYCGDDGGVDNEEEDPS